MTLVGLAARKLAQKQRTAKLAAAFPNGIRCQRCLQKGHWSYECREKRKYVHRSSRTKQLTKHLAQKDANKIETATRVEEAQDESNSQNKKTKRRRRRKNSSSSTSSTSSSTSSNSSGSSSDSSTGSGSTDTNSSDSSSDSEDSSSTGGQGSAAGSSSSSNDTDSSDDETPNKMKKCRESTNESEDARAGD